MLLMLLPFAARIAGGLPRRRRVAGDGCDRALCRRSPRRRVCVCVCVVTAKEGLRGGQGSQDCCRRRGSPRQVAAHGGGVVAAPGLPRVPAQPPSAVVRVPHLREGRD